MSQDGQERAATPDEKAGMDWWNGMSDAARSAWLGRVAAAPSPANAWAAWKVARAARLDMEAIDRLAGRRP